MASDDDFHELLTTFPEALLALLGVQARGPYRGEAVEVKATGRFDAVLRPTVEGDPRVYLEWQDWRNRDLERRYALKLLAHCLQEDSYEPVIAAVVYTNAPAAGCVLPATAQGPAGPMLSFTPIRLVLTDVPPERLLALGGPALLLLPLVGTADRVVTDARRWRALVRDELANTAVGQDRAVEIFMSFLAWRLDTLDLDRLLGEEGTMPDWTNTATGRGVARRAAMQHAQRVLVRQVTRRFGPLPAELVTRIEAADQEALDRWLDRFATASSLDEVFGEG